MKNIKTKDRPYLHAGRMEIAVVQLLNYRVYTIIPNIREGLGLGHEADLLARDKQGRYTEIEIKISKADLKRDTEKKHGHSSRFISRLIFAVPEELVEFAKTVIPEHAGLIQVGWYSLFPPGHKRAGEGYWKASWVKQVRHDKTCGPAPAWWNDELGRLAAMRIWTLKESLYHCQDRKIPKL